jgi:hypothetical protein
MLCGTHDHWSPHRRPTKLSGRGGRTHAITKLGTHTEPRRDWRYEWGRSGRYAVRLQVCQIRRFVGVSRSRQRERRQGQRHSESLHGVFPFVN